MYMCVCVCVCVCFLLSLNEEIYWELFYFEILC